MNKTRFLVYLALAVGLAPAQAGEPVEPSRDDLLRIAFGADAVEATRPIRLLIRDRGLVLTATHLFVEGDGRVKVTDMSAAWFPTELESPKEPLTTVRSKWVRVTLDRPATSLRELANRRWVSIELPGGVIIGSSQKANP
jgi:hypothetical protein